MFSCPRVVLTSRAHLSQTVHKATIGFWGFMSWNLLQEQAGRVGALHETFFSLHVFFYLEKYKMLNVWELYKVYKFRLRYPVLEVECYIVLLHTKQHGLNHEFISCLISMLHSMTVLYCSAGCLHLISQEILKPIFNSLYFVHVSYILNIIKKNTHTFLCAYTTIQKFRDGKIG